MIHVFLDMIVLDEMIVASLKEKRMKKLMIALMALSFLTATVGVSFAKDEKDTTKSTKKNRKKKTTAPTVQQN